jgi:hypothetical protein
MKRVAIGVCVILAIVAAGWAGGTPNDPGSSAVGKGAAWLASVQGRDGGWGQDGGETTYIRQGEHLESNGNDVANTAAAALALLRAGKQYQPNVERAIDFILRKVDASPADGLAITDLNGTQIQRKLGPYIDTFLTSRLLSEVDGTLSPTVNARVRKGLEKCVAKIERNQKSDGSWNLAGGWAPVLGTSLASRSLYDAKQKGVKVEDRVMSRAEAYTVGAIAAPAGRPENAGVGLYQSAQALEQLSRTEGDRVKNAPQIAAIKGQLSNDRFVEGFGSIGGEEFFSYLNVSDGLRRAGGEEWTRWNKQITAKVLALQNNDGTWSGHHCITGRVAVTSAAILNLTVDREPLR